MSGAGTDLEAKSALLQTHLRTLGRLLVAYSGGVDSAYLAWAAHQALGDNMLAVIADSPSLARTQLADAVAFAAGARRFRWKWSPPRNWTARSMYATTGSAASSAKTSCFPDGRTAAGARLRCHRLRRQRGRSGRFSSRSEGSVAHHVAAPLLDAGLTKEEIRALARKAGLRIWDKPASACLSSRIEYGRPVTREALTWSRRVKTRCALWDSGNSGCGTMAKSCASKSPARS